MFEGDGNGTTFADADDYAEMVNEVLTAMTENEAKHALGFLAGAAPGIFLAVLDSLACSCAELGHEH